MSDRDIIRKFLRRKTKIDWLSEQRFLKMLKDNHPKVDFSKVVVFESEKVDSISKYLLETNRYEIFKIIDRKHKYGKKS